uniref:hypothetical protein n=1 Tax=Porphyridium aerugineum TaxID=2792 RepID=UPI001FCCDF91|nr:hypothetical protein MW505_pgp022 [Porphyridium aerugineum]UNJ17975.1 hypothetical protein [Porphyridium aerugineum]
MSHLTKIKTTIRDENTLQIALSDLGLKWNKIVDILSVKNKASYVIKQDNNVDLLFSWNGQDYELVTDLQFWQQSSPVEVFLNKLNQRYAYNCILDKAKNLGFESIKEIKNNQGSITLTLRRWT